MTNDGDFIEATLIDYGFISTFLDENGDHIPKESSDVFYGNLMFASLDQLLYIKPSRRSDL